MSNIALHSAADEKSLDAFGTCTLSVDPTYEGVAFLFLEEGELDIRKGSGEMNTVERERLGMGMAGIDWCVSVD